MADRSGDRAAARGQYPRPHTGEHWSEKVAAEIGAALQVPSADVHLATYRGQQGCCVRSFAPPASRLSLVHGNELLQEFDASYPVAQVHSVARHTVAAVLGALRGTTAPPGAVAAPLQDGAAWFLGYLLLDALILNCDRHHENWGVLQPEGGGGRALAPSYDHASSLGRELDDTKRVGRLRTRDHGYSVAAYVSRARSALFRSDLDKKPAHPADAFLVGREIDRAAGDHWLERLATVGESALADIVRAVPPSFMSEPSREFAIDVTRIARARLLGSV